MWGEEQFPNIVSRGPVDYLYCVAKYPTRWEELHFDDVDFTRYAGFSDHTLGVEAALVAAARGARILEKHFTLDKKMHGPDHACSMEPGELAEISKYARRFEQLLTAGQTAEVTA
jgi:sialic acid synthase SpsE